MMLIAIGITGWVMHAMFWLSALLVMVMLLLTININRML